MRTSVKILLLVLFSIGAIAGVLVFAKTRVAPPSNLKPVDQYTLDLKKECAAYDSITDFSQSRDEYARLDDKLKRYLMENAIDAKTSDEFRKAIDKTYGDNLCAYGLSIFQKSVWPDEQLNEMLKLIDALKPDKLSTGESAVTQNFVNSAKKINDIVGNYHAALRLSRNTSFTGVNDASSKISKARSLRSSEYLKNNTSLVSALDAMPGRIAKSHYNYVSSRVDALGGYYNVSKDYYMNKLIPQADKAINEYKSTKIYGGNKQSISGLEDRAVKLVTAAMSYYGD